MSRIRKRVRSSALSSPTVSGQVTIVGAAHFLQEDRGEQIAAGVLKHLA